MSKNRLESLSLHRNHFFVVKFTFAVEGCLLSDVISRNFIHFAEVFHVGILYKKDGRWWVRESSKQDWGVVSVPFISFYERYRKCGSTVELLEVNCDDAIAKQAADWAKSANGTYFIGQWPDTWPYIPPGKYSCSSFVFYAYYRGAGIDLNPPGGPRNPGWIAPTNIYDSAKTMPEGPIEILRLGDVSGNGSVSSYDASLAARYSVGLVSLTYEQIQAADVTGNGTVSGYDASFIARYVVGLIHTFPIEEMKSRTSISEIALEEQVNVTVGSACGSPGDVNIENSITVTDVAGLGIIGLDLQLDYDASKLAFSRLSTTGTIVEGWAYAVNERTSGSVEIALYNTQSMVGQGTLLQIYLDVHPQATNGTSVLNLIKAEFNEGAISSSLQDGSITVSDIQVKGDVNRDCYVDIFDLDVLCSHWLNEGCCDPNWCERTDLDASESVDFVDFSIFAADWLKHVGP